MRNVFSPILISVLLLLQFYACTQSTGGSVPLKDVSVTKEHKTNLTEMLDKKTWNLLFPNRYGVKLKDSINHNPDFYSYTAFVNAAKLFPDFLNEGTPELQKRELCAFLANIAQE